MVDVRIGQCNDHSTSFIILTSSSILEFWHIHVHETLYKNKRIVRNIYSLNRDVSTYIRIMHSNENNKAYFQECFIYGMVSDSIHNIMI